MSILEFNKKTSGYKYDKGNRWEFFVRFSDSGPEKDFLETCNNMIQFDTSLIAVKQNGCIRVSSTNKSYMLTCSWSPWDMLFHRAMGHANVGEAKISSEGIAAPKAICFA